MLRFVLAFSIVLIGLMWLVIHNVVQLAFIMPFTALLAKISGGLILLFDSNVASHGNIIQSTVSGIGVAILPGCNAVEASIILISGIIAFPASWCARLVGVVVGILAVQLVNIVRIVSLFYLAQWNDFIFQIAHGFVWQILIMLDVLVFWLIWLKYLARNEQFNLKSQTKALI